MQLELIIGRAASGKTQRLYEQVGRSLERTDGTPVLVLVPDQTTVSTERGLMEALGLQGSMKIQVMSPKHLAQNVFARMGGSDHTIIDERGRAMALRRVCAQELHSLKVLGRVAGRSAFAAHLSSLISDLKRFRVDAGSLREASSRVVSAQLRDKLQDLSLLMEAYDGWMQSRSRMDDEDAMLLMADKLGQDAFWRGADVYIDGFDYLPPGNIAWIAALTAVARKVTITLCADVPEAPDGDIFAAGWMSRDALMRMAKDMGCPVREVYTEREDSRRSASLGWLERALYAYPTPEAPSDARGVAFLHPADPEEEAEQAARLVSSWVRRDGLRYRDIVVLCGDLANSSLRLKRVFSRFEIPLFLDERRSVLNHPLVNFAVKGMETVSGGYRADAFLDCLKSGFCGLDRETLEQWERQIASTRGRGRRALFGPYRRAAQGVADTALLNEAGERIRAALERLEALHRRRASAMDWADGLEAFMRTFSVPEQLQERCRALEQVGDRDTAAETAQVWEEWTDMLEQLRSVLGETPLDADEAAEVLEAGFERAEVGVLPVGVDRVLCGDIGRTKTGPVRRMIILGAADGTVPARYPEDALLNDRDIAALEDLELTVGRDAGLRMAQSQFGVYHVMAYPEEMLVLSCPEKEDSGAALRRSTVMERIDQLLKPETLRPDPFEPASRDAMLGTAAESLRRMSIGLAPDPRLRPLLSALRQGGSEKETDSLCAREDASDRISVPLLGDTVSVSRLEEYADCPFRWFAANVLRPEAWEEGTIQAAGAGIALHEAVSRFGYRVRGREELTPEEAEREMNAVLDDVFQEEPWPVRMEQPESAFLAERMRSACLRTARLWSESLKRGAFRPEQFEMEFGRSGGSLPLILSDGSVLEWTGYVDRVDRWAREDADVFRVIDYKSGMPQPSAAGAAQGTQLQLWIYLATVCALSEASTGRPALPGGVYYAPVGDTFENLKTGESGDREALRMQGWTVDDDAILEATDREVREPGQESSYVTLDRGAKKFPSSQVKSPEYFRILLEGAKRTAVRLAEGMKAGEIPPAPVVKGFTSACDYCEHRALCALRGPKKPVKALTDTQAMEILRGEAE